MATPPVTAANLVRDAVQLERLGRLHEAIAVYERLLARWPDLPDCWYNLGLLQRRTRQFDGALASYAQALARGVTAPEEVHLNRSVIFADYLRQDAAAETELTAALLLNPGYLPALQNLANLYEDLGRREEALATYARLLELKPDAFEVLARYAQVAGVRGPEDPLLGRLRAALARPEAGAADRAALGFALARLLDSCGEYAEAFAACSAANRASRSSASAGVQYDRSAMERFVDELIRTFPAARRRSGGAPGAPRPLFICGMFRSGSTLAEQILATRPGVAAGGELDLLSHLVHSQLTPFPALAQGLTDSALAGMAQEYLASVGRVFPDAATVTDKRPDNFLLVGLIKSLFPHARIVHTTRDPLDTCLSIFFLHLDHSMSYALDLMDIGHYYRQYRRLMLHWQSLYGADILNFCYDTLVHEPRSATQRLLAFCDLPWDEGCLSFAPRRASVKSASVWQVREPLYQRSSGRAQHYVRELAALAAYLAQP